MNFEKHFGELDESVLNFIATEVSTSLTFAKLAQDTRRDHAKRERNLGDALRGYDTALYFLRRAIERHDAVSPHTIEGMKILRLMLREMGQSILE